MKNITLTLFSFSLLFSCVAEQAPTDYTGLIGVKNNKNIHFFVEEDSVAPVKVVIEKSEENVNLRLNILSSPKNGELVECEKSETELNCLYVPFPDFNGSDELSFNSSDGSFKSERAFIKIKVGSVPDAPILKSNTLYFSTTTNKTIRFALPRARDVDGGRLKYELTQGNDSNNLYCYTKNDLYQCEYNSQNVGIESFSYRAYDETNLRSDEVAFIVATESTKCGNLSEGASQRKVFYKLSQVLYGLSCEQQERVRTCSAGVLSPWSGSYIYETCEVQKPRSCGNMSHGESEFRTRYLRSREPFGGSCKYEVQQRSCTDGVMSNWTGSYSTLSCNVEGAKNCGNLVHGSFESRTRYKDLEVSPGETCHSEVQKRSCSEGSLSAWTGSFINLSCRIRNYNSCGSLSHGGSRSRIRYRSSAVEYSETCEQEVQVQLCDDGELGSWSGSYTKLNCYIKEPLDCDEINHGEEKERRKYAQVEVEPNEFCRSERQVQSCTNGQTTPWSGTYQFDQCRIRGYKNCGETIHGEEEARIRYKDSLVGVGEACIKQEQVRKCFDGGFSTWTGTFTHKTCRSPNEVKDKFTTYKNRADAVDIVWVIDNSGSMGGEQQQLSSSLGDFISHFINKSIDFKMAVTHSDTRYAPANQLSVQESLALLNTAKAKENESKFMNDFKRILKVGVSGSGRERMFAGAERFGKSFPTFFRKNAHSILIMFTDEKEQSKQTTQQVIDALTPNKSNEGLLKTYLFHVDGKDKKMEELSRKTSGFATALSQSDISVKLNEIGEEISTLVGGYSLSDRPDTKENIKVLVNGAEVTNWVYDEASNSVKLDSNNFSQEENEVEITYISSESLSTEQASYKTNSIVQSFAQSLESEVGGEIMRSLGK